MNVHYWQGRNVHSCTLVPSSLVIHSTVLYVHVSRLYMLCLVRIPILRYYVFLNACSLKSVQLRVRTCAILIFRQFCSECFVELLFNIHFAFILERDCIVHAVVQKTNLMYI